MGGFVVIGMLAAFGLVCALWTVAGLLLPRDSGGILIYLGREPESVVQQYLWLREMGLMRRRLFITEYSENGRQWFSSRGIELCSREELIRLLEMGEDEIDAGA